MLYSSWLATLRRSVANRFTSDVEEVFRNINDVLQVERPAQHHLDRQAAMNWSSVTSVKKRMKPILMKKPASSSWPGSAEWRSGTPAPG